MKELFVQYRKWIVAAVAILVIWKLAFGGNEGLTKEEFEEGLKTISDGRIVIADSKFINEKKNSLYMAEWNGFTITAKVEDNRLVLPYGILTYPVGQLDEISLGQYRQLAADLSGLADSKLSVDERNSLIDNELNFNHFIMNGGDYSTSKNGLNYLFSGATNPNVVSTFLVKEEGD